jgi:predicted metalloendopeptidase
MFVRVILILMVDACGGWEKRVEIPSDRGRYGTIDEASEANDRILRDIFSGEYPFNPPKNNLPDPKQAVDQQNFEKLQDAYQACLNETTINEVGAAPLLAILENIIAKYPVESACHPMKFKASPDKSLPNVDTDKKCSDSKDSLTDVIEYLQSIGVGALFSLAVTVRNSISLGLYCRKTPKIQVST